MSESPLTFQDMILALEHYWADKGCTVKNVQTGETFFVECDSVVNGIGFVPTPVGGKDNKNVHRVGDCVAIGNLRTVIWRAWDVCMKI